MLDITFFDNKNEQTTISVSDFCYERLAKIGLSSKVKYEDVSLTVEGEKHEVNATELTDKNRKSLLEMVEDERQEVLLSIFKQLDNSPTVKEIRESFSYIKELTFIYQQLKCSENIYLSYS
jgi:hypothetical protein